MPLLGNSGWNVVKLKGQTVILKLSGQTAVMLRGLSGQTAVSSGPQRHQSDASRRAAAGGAGEEPQNIKTQIEIRQTTARE